MPLKNLKELRAYQREWARKWRKKNPEKMRERGRNWYHKNLKKARRHAVKSAHKRKIQVLTYYGKSGRLCCCWPNCHVVDIDMLTLDHIKNNGAAHRKSGECGLGSATYRWAIKRGFPEGFQTLCANHQLKKEIHRHRKKAER